MYTSFNSSEEDVWQLYEQWEEGDEPLLLDELPDGDPRRPQPLPDFSKLDMSDTDGVTRALKKGKSMMVFVTVADSKVQCG